MSAMSSQRRKLAIDRKPKNDRLYVKGDYPKWLKGAKAELASFSKPDEYLNHAVNRRNVFISIMRDRNAREDRALAMEARNA